MRVADQIHTLLSDALEPVRLEVLDQSQLHAGHAGARPEGQTHFEVTIVSAFFEGELRVKRHRRVNAVLAALMDNPIHALQLKTLTPDEDKG